MSESADYGLDAPAIVRNMLVGGGLMFIAGAVASNLRSASGGVRALGMVMCWIGASYLATGALMVLSSRIGKLRARDQLLARVPLAPTSAVLDVGCGRGLLLIAVAKKLPHGRVAGVDLWSQTDQGDNSRAATLANAAAEGVADRVDVRDGDMRALPFADASFDAVVSSLAIHNVSAREDRRRAIAEIVRVLRPGGTVAIMDIAHVGQYAADLRAAGLHVEPLRLTPWIFPPTRVLVAHAESRPVVIGPRSAVARPA